MSASILQILRFWKQKLTWQHLSWSFLTQRRNRIKNLKLSTFVSQVLVYWLGFFYSLRSLSNSNYFTQIMSTRKLEFASAICKKLNFSKYSIKRCCKQITSIQKLVWPYKYILNGVMRTGRLSIAKPIYGGFYPLINWYFTFKLRWK